MQLPNYFVFVLCFVYVKSAVIANDGDVVEQGLYSKSDHVVILTSRNFNRNVYNQPVAMLVQFYNSYCGHCRAFAPKFKGLAAELQAWNNVIKLAVIDCSVEENNEMCRNFDVMAYPSIRYLHEKYVKANGNVGENFQPTFAVPTLKAQIISKLQSEQAAGRLRYLPPLNIVAYNSFVDALADVPTTVLFTFLVFESETSITGSELILDMLDYPNVRVKRVDEMSDLANVAGLQHFPGLVAVHNNRPTPLTTISASKDNMLRAVNTYLTSYNYLVPERQLNNPNMNNNNNGKKNKIKPMSEDHVYYSDLEKTIKTSLHTEITRHQTLTGTPLQALLDYLNILITVFPSRGNLKQYLTDLKFALSQKMSYKGEEVYNLVKTLEETNYPVYTTDLEYVACKGSLSKYRGYTCGLWTLFHTLTVNAAQKPGVLGPQVLKAMHGYVKNFFGCTDCAQHFQEMAARNKIFDVKDNDKAVLWLWISHNEVNLRLAGDVTEDPEHPKIQFPSSVKCPECRTGSGSWNLPVVYEYLQSVYGADNIQGSRQALNSGSAASPFSNLDIGMLSLLYIFSFFTLIIVIKFFFTKRFYRRRNKHAWGKV